MQRVPHCRFRALENGSDDNKLSLFSLACNSYGRFSSLFHHILLRLVYEPDWRRYYCCHRCCRVADTVRLLYLWVSRNTTRCFDNRRESGIKNTFSFGKRSPQPPSPIEQILSRTDTWTTAGLRATCHVYYVYTSDLRLQRTDQLGTWTIIFYSNEPARLAICLRENLFWLIIS